jgi:hypothetical protein
MMALLGGDLPPFEDFSPILARAVRLSKQTHFAS